ncbi:MAG: hypothetical protein AB1295_04600 [Candidatus Micrarchaeota archaeon]
MENKNDFTLKAVGGTLLALLLAMGIFVLADQLFPFRQLGPRAEQPDIMPYIFMAQIFLSLLMLLLSFYLMFIYMKDYLQLKSRFTFGLLVAVFSFMLFAIAANPMLHAFLGVYGGRGLFPLIPYVFATLSLGILVWVSSK